MTDGRSLQLAGNAKEWAFPSPPPNYRAKHMKDAGSHSGTMISGYRVIAIMLMLVTVLVTVLVRTL